MSTSGNPQEGKIKLLTALFAVVCLSVFTIIQYNLAVGPQKLPSQIIRLCLTIFLCVAVYRGSSLARGVMVVLYSIGTVMFIYINFTLDRVPWLTQISIAFNALTCAYLAYALAISKDVSAFLAKQ